MVISLNKLKWLSLSVVLLMSFAWAEDNVSTELQQGQSSADVQRQLEQIRALQEQHMRDRGIGGSSQVASNAQQPTTSSGLNINDAVPHQQYMQAKPASKGVSQEAFTDMVTQVLPLSPMQIHHLRQMYSASQAAAAADAGVPPRPTATTQLVSLEPGSTPPVIRLAQGYVSSVVFLDSTGAPWPIAAYSLGDPEAFNIVWNQKDNTMMIQADKLYKTGNLAVRLQGLQTPVMVSLIPGQKAVDYRVDMRVQGMGPNARPLAGSNLPNAINNELLKVLDGGSPRGGVMLQTDNGLAQVWAVGGRLYLRSHYPVISPAWQSTVSSADGTHVYEMPVVNTVLLSVHGKVRQLKLKGL